jgi:hypothetical protein
MDDHIHLSEADERRPVPYECDITPRFPEAAALLAQELELRGL